MYIQNSIKWSKQQERLKQFINNIFLELFSILTVSFWKSHGTKSSFSMAKFMKTLLLVSGGNRVKEKQIIFRLTGNMLPKSGRDFIAISGLMNVVFSTDASVVYRGFHGFFRSE